ncbi:MAG: hypothetical protein U0401_09940 [Anaerolineae bacterium]
MRFIATVTGHSEVKRLMTYDNEHGVYLFIYQIEEDGGCSSDLWFETIEDAQEAAQDEYGVKLDEWVEIPDPPEHCQQDWIAPARIPGREIGNPQWGKLEVFKDGEWIKIMG